jgi:hypothetical protein
MIEITETCDGSHPCPERSAAHERNAIDSNPEVSFGEVEHQQGPASA